MYSTINLKKDNNKVCEGINCSEIASIELSMKTKDNKIIKFQLCDKCKNLFFNNGANSNYV
jgi:hypothetical protein